MGDLTRAGDDHAVQPAAAAGIHDTLAALPNGYRTLLTQTFFDLADRGGPADRRAAVRRPVAARWRWRGRSCAAAGT